MPSVPTRPVRSATSPVAFARENGWLQLVLRAWASGFRRLRDQSTAGRLHAPGFRAGSNPRLLGLAHMQVGKNFRAGDDFWLEAVVAYGEQRFSPALVIGDNVSVSDRVHIACINRVTIGAGTLIGSRVIVTDHAHGVYRGESQTGPDLMPVARPLHSPGAVTIGRNVWIGDGVAVLPGSNIGDGTVIGANSVVTGMIPPATIAVGSPAKAVRRWDAGAGEWVALR